MMSLVCWNSRPELKAAASLTHPYHSLVLLPVHDALGLLEVEARAEGGRLYSSLPNVVHLVLRAKMDWRAKRRHYGKEGFLVRNAHAPAPPPPRPPGPPMPATKHAPPFCPLSPPADLDERDEGRDDDGETGEERRRELVAQGFAPSLEVWGERCGERGVGREVWCEVV
jgi:hypothetical protein